MLQAKMTATAELRSNIIPEGINFFVFRKRQPNKAARARATIVAIRVPLAGELWERWYAMLNSKALIKLAVNEMRLPDLRQPIMPPATRMAA